MERTYAIMCVQTVEDIALLMDVALLGADVIQEILRWVCIWDNYGKDGIGGPWWEYVTEFISRCNTEEEFVNNQCTNKYRRISDFREFRR